MSLKKKKKSSTPRGGWAAPAAMPAASRVAGKVVGWVMKGINFD